MTTPPPAAPPPGPPPGQQPGPPPAGPWSPPVGASPDVPPPVPPAGVAAGDRRSRRGLIIGVGVALVTAMVVVAAVVVLGGDDGPAPIATDEIVDAIGELERVVADERAAADRDGDSMFVGLEPCPLGEVDELWAFAPEGLDLAAPDDPSTAIAITIFEAGADQPTMFQCSAGAGESGALMVGSLVARASDSSHRTYVRRTLSNGDVEFGETFEHRGGEIVPYCFEADADALFSFCAADWVTDDVQIGVYVARDDAAVVEQLLVASLDHLVEQLLVNARDVEIVEE